MRWYGKLLGFIAGALLFRPNPLFGAVIGLLVGHAFDADWFRLRRRENPYSVLGLTEEASNAEVDPRASDAEVEAAYRRLIAQYHPDRVAGAAAEIRDLAETRARAINAAYERIQRIRKGALPR